MLSEVQLHEHQDLHGHVGLVHDGAGEGQMPPVSCFAVHYLEEDIRQVHQPSPAFLHYHTASLSPEDGAGETGDFTPCVLRRERKALEVYSSTTFVVSSSELNTSSVTSSAFIFLCPFVSSKKLWSVIIEGTALRRRYRETRR